MSLFINNVHVTVDDNEVLKGVNLELKPGTIHALMGPNGSGKSSLAYALLGHPEYDITQGAITLTGENVLELSTDKRAQLGIFLGFQYPESIPGVNVFTVLKEMDFALHGELKSVTEYSKEFEAYCAVLNIPTTFLDRPLNEGFSGGEKKKLEILQMLVARPKYAFLDEIDSGLDIDALKVVARGIAFAYKQNPSMSIVLITHYARILNYLIPDFVHIMVDGTIVRSGDSSVAFDLEAQGYDGLLKSLA